MVWFCKILRKPPYTAKSVKCYSEICDIFEPWCKKEGWPLNRTEQPAFRYDAPNRLREDVLHVEFSDEAGGVTGFFINRDPLRGRETLGVSIGPGVQ